MPFDFPALIVQTGYQRLYQIIQWNHCNCENYELQLLDMPTKIKDQKWHSPFSLNTKKLRIQCLLSPICCIVRILSPGEWSVCSGNYCTTQEWGPTGGRNACCLHSFLRLGTMLPESLTLCGSRGKCANERSSYEIWRQKCSRVIILRGMGWLDTQLCSRLREPTRCSTILASM